MRPDGHAVRKANSCQLPASIDQLGRYRKAVAADPAGFAGALPRQQQQRDEAAADQNIHQAMSIDPSHGLELLPNFFVKRDKPWIGPASRAGYVYDDLLAEPSGVGCEHDDAI